MKGENTFVDLGIRNEIADKLNEMEINAPTAVQSEAIPEVLAGRNLLVQSPTGTGKTLAYLTPILSQLDIQSKELQGIVLLPSRELAVQVARLAKSFYDNLRVVTLIGGANPLRQLEGLKEKPQLAIGTPGRVLELIEKRKINGQTIKTIVVDEADKMFTTGFMEDIHAILKATLRTRQVLFFSATIPLQLKDIAAEFMLEPRFLNVQEEGRVPKTITHLYFMSAKEQKTQTLVKLLKLYKPKKAIVFIQRNEGVDSLVRRLHDWGVEAAALHSELPQQQRREILEKFRQGKSKVLVTTDLMARGMDIPGIDYIFNYDLPIDEKHYLHRAGRTGRAGKSGTAVTIVAEEQKQIIPKFARTLAVPFTQMGIGEEGVFPVAYARKIKNPVPQNWKRKDE